jgi:hypothetical protein
LLAYYQGRFVGDGKRMDKLFLPTTRARNLFAPDRCSVHLRILSRAGCAILYRALIGGGGQTFAAMAYFTKEFFEANQSNLVDRRFFWNRVQVARSGRGNFCFNSFLASGGTSSDSQMVFQVGGAHPEVSSTSSMQVSTRFAGGGTTAVFSP